MKKWVILLVFALIVVSMTGCETAKYTSRRNLNYLCDDTMRAFNLDQPSALHARDLESNDMYESYRGYD